MIYTVIKYVALCDKCGKEMPGSPFNNINEPREAILNNPDCLVIEGKGFCPECSKRLKENSNEQRTTRQTLE